MRKVDRYAGGGSQVVTLRIDDELLARIDGHIARINTRRSSEPHSRASWIKACITEVLGKAERSARSKARKRAERPIYVDEGRTETPATFNRRGNARQKYLAVPTFEMGDGRGQERIGLECPDPLPLV